MQIRRLDSLQISNSNNRTFFTVHTSRPAPFVTIDPYKVLRISAQHALDGDQLRKVYRDALLQAHPDKQSARSMEANTIDDVRDAYQNLSDTTKRCIAYEEMDLDDFSYDAQLNLYRAHCRCTSKLVIDEGDLTNGRDLITCTGCSSVTRIAYRVLEGT